MAASKKAAPARRTTKRTARATLAKTKTPSGKASPARPRIFAISFASVYPLYVQKAEKKGRTKAEVDALITWLTGYERAALQRVIESRIDLEAFFARAPRMNPNAGLITGTVCGVRVEDVADPLMQKIRYLDKLIDELAKGWPLERIRREETAVSTRGRLGGARGSAARSAGRRRARAFRRRGTGSPR